MWIKAYHRDLLFLSFSLVIGCTSSSNLWLCTTTYQLKDPVSVAFDSPLSDIPSHFLQNVQPTRTHHLRYRIWIRIWWRNATWRPGPRGRYTNARHHISKRGRYTNAPPWIGRWCLGLEHVKWIRHGCVFLFFPPSLSSPTNELSTIYLSYLNRVTPCFCALHRYATQIPLQSRLRLTQPQVYKTKN